MKLKALKDFRGQPGEGTSPHLLGDRFVEAGCEFHADERRAAWLEKMGHAVPVGEVQAAAPAPREAEVRNAAAEAGPLPSAGGRIGAAKAASSSPAAPARKTPASAKRKAAARS